MAEDTVNHQEALDLIRDIEMLGFFFNEIDVKMKYAKSIFHCMDVLKVMHDDLVSKLPKEVIEAERQKQSAPKPSQIIKPNGLTPADVVA